MNVAAAEIETLRLRLSRPLVTSQGGLAIREGFLLRLTGRTGEVGWGEASPAYWIGEESLARTAEDLRRVVALARARASGADLRARFLLGEMRESLSTAAACALDSALLDLEARTQGVALSAMLGATGAAEVTVAALVGGATTAGLTAEVDAARTRGFTTMKLKVGALDLAEDVRRVATVRARVGPAIALRLDANRAWTPAEARRALAAFAPFAIDYLEEPLRNADPEAIAALARATSLLLAVDESIADAADLRRLVDTGAPVHVVLKAARVGGPTQLLALARMAHAAGLPVVVTDSIESTVGMSVAVHVAGALPGSRLAVGLGGAQLAAGAHPLRASRLVASGPGLRVDRGGAAVAEARRA